MQQIKQFLGVGFLVFLSYLAYQHPQYFDLTFNKTNSLNEKNLDFLSSIDKPFLIQLYTQDHALKEKIETMLSLFQRESRHIQFKFETTPLSSSEKTSLGLQSNHHLLLSYDNQVKALDIKLDKLSLQDFSHLIYQTLRNKSQWIVFLSGHGEADPLDSDNENNSLLVSELKNKGLQITTLNLAELGVIPDNTETLVINSPKTSLLPYETQKILDYLEKGGNLLWIQNPGSTVDTSIAKTLGIEWSNGIIQDLHARKLGASFPEMSVITKYPDHELSHKLKLLTVFPWSRPFQIVTNTTLDWQAAPFLVTDPETNLQEGKKIIPGPFILGATLSKGEQRIAVIGNSHFLSNAGIRNYGNMQLANNIFNWLNIADLPLNISYQPPIDAVLTQNKFTHILFKYFFPFGLALIYLFVGFQIKNSRQKRYFQVRSVFDITQIPS